MHRRVNILQYVKTPIGHWQWEPIPKNRRTGNLIWSKAKSDQLYIVWREDKRRHYQKAGNTPAGALEAKQRKELELAGRAVLQDGKQIPQPKNHGFTIEVAVADFLEFTKNQKRPNTHKRYRAVLVHISFLNPAWEPSDVRHHLYSCGYERDEDALEVETQWVRNKTSPFSSLLMPR